MAIRIIKAEPDPQSITKPRKKAKEAAPVVEQSVPSQKSAKPVSDAPNGHKRRGFASMSEEKRKLLAAKGGANSPREKRHFVRNPDAARKAGAKGGSISKRRSKITATNEAQQ